MAKKPTLSTIASGYASNTTLNSNFEELRDAFDNTLSLDGSTPNAMGADLDLNGNNIIGASGLTVNGTDYLAEVTAAKAAALVAQAAAETAETNAETAETNAESSETAAASSASAASSSATASAASAVDSTNNGAAQVALAAAQVALAGTARTGAETAETNAETAAALSTTNGAAQVVLATAQVALASTEATNAATSATTATTQASTATTQAGIATTKAGEASASASAAAASAASITDEEANAAASAAASAGSATASANSAAASAAALDTFDDRYLGSKTANPTLDNDGDALVAGALYFNSTANEMRVYDGANWIAASSSGVASMNLYEYTATSGQTTFTGADDNGNSISFIAGNEIVVLNGVILDPSDYNSTSGTSIVLASGAATGDLLNVYAFKSFTVADTVSASAGGTFGGNVAFGANATFGDNDKAIFGAGSDLQIYHDGSSSYISELGTGDLRLGGVNIRIGDNTSGASYIYATQNAEVTLYNNGSPKLATTSTGVDVTGTVTADGLTVDGNATLQNILNIGGADPQIRTDTSDGSDNKTLWMGGGGVAYSWDRGGYFYAQGNEAGGHVGIAAGNISGASIKFTTAASEAMRITAAGSVGINTTSSDSYYAKKLVVDCGTDGQNGITIKSSTTGAGMFAFADGTSGSDRYRGYINYNHADDSMTLGTAGGSGTVSVSSTGTVTAAGLNVDTDGSASAVSIGLNDGNSGFFKPASNTIGFSTGGAEHMRLTNTGDALFGTADDSIAGASGGSNTGIKLDGGEGQIQATSVSGVQLYLNRQSTGGDVAVFRKDAADVGSISVTGSSTSYNTSSDYRLKTDAQPMVGASARVQALNPVNFEWIASGDRVDGFLAHEAATVVPESVTGTKDAMMDEEYEVTAAIEATYDDDGNELTAAVDAVMGTRNVPDYQGIDQSKLVPLLTAALQEALNKIDTMETRLAALEAV